MADKHETFTGFIQRRPEFQPVKGEVMASVYRKQHDAFIAYVNEQEAINKRLQSGHGLTSILHSALNLFLRG